MGRIWFAASIAAIALVASSCGGDDDSNTPTTTAGVVTTLTSQTIPDDQADVRRSTSLVPVGVDLTATAEATNPNRANKQDAQATDYAGNPDFRAEREQCGVALGRGPKDTAVVNGTNFLLPDPLTGKTLSIGSSARVSQSSGDVETKLNRLKDSSTISCMQRVIQERATAERTKRNLNESQLQATQTTEVLSLPGLGSRTVAYRTHLTVALQGATPVDQYIDLLVTYVDRAEIAVTIESAGVPPSNDFDKRLVDRIRGNAIRALAAR